MNITNHYNAPLLALNIKNHLDTIENHEEYIFVIQLNYRENHTICPLKEIGHINFDEDFLEIQHTDGTVNYYDYQNISEYHIVYADNLADLWSNEI